MSVAPRIYDFLDYRAFLRAWLAHRDGRPSMRALAERAHMSPALLSAILHGRRVLDSSRVETVGTRLGLEGEALDYFRHLVTWQHDGSAANRREAFHQVLTSRHYHSARTVDDETYELFSHWMLPAICELARCLGWRDEPAWIAAQFPEDVDEERVRAALRTLESLGALVRDAEGRLQSTEQSWATPHELDKGVLDQALSDLHVHALQRAAERLDEVPGTERQYGMLTMALTREQVVVLKDRLTRVLQEVLAIGEDRDSPAERVYNVGFQLYPLTHWVGGEE